MNHSVIGMVHKTKVGIVVVLYGSDKINVELERLPKNSLLIFVDNTPMQNLSIENTFQIRYIPLNQNLGIAEAQNRGIQAAKEANCTHIIFFDQDSLVPENFISKMVEEYERICVHQPNLFLLGPIVKNEREGRNYGSTIHKSVATDFGFIPQREIISSGSCVRMDRIERIGKLESELFIDFVDFEWCWRGNFKGYVSGMTSSVELAHFVGQSEYRILNQLIIISSPVRYYYQTRNYLRLLKRRYVPRQWKVAKGIKNILFPLTYPFKVDNWKAIYKNIWRGFTDGLKS